MQPFAELICAYLDGMPDADAILNDALEEAGRERLAVPGTASERLTVVLENLISDSLARRLPVDYARHVMKYLDSPRAQEVLTLKESSLAADPNGQSSARASMGASAGAMPPLVEGELGPQVFGYLHDLGWEEESTPKSSAAWALWGALVIPVRHVASAAQRTLQDEVKWQVEHVKNLLME